MFTGMDALAANITSCAALFPAQVATGWTGRKLRDGAQRAFAAHAVRHQHRRRRVGAAMLLARRASFFARLVPWLVLFATVVFAWGSFFRKPGDVDVHLSPPGAALAQFLISVYGGYFGGGIGFLMVAALTMAGQGVRVASATKNVLAGVMNASAVAIFLFSPDLHWPQALVTSVGRDDRRRRRRPPDPSHRRKNPAHLHHRGRRGADRRPLSQSAIIPGARRVQRVVAAPLAIAFSISGMSVVAMARRRQRTDEFIGDRSVALDRRTSPARHRRQNRSPCGRKDRRRSRAKRIAALRQGKL